MPLDLSRRTREEPLCIHHGPACALGTRPLPEIYVLAIEAKRRLGQETPPLDEHRLMAPKERKRYEREMRELLASLRARNDQLEAELRAGQANEINSLEES